MDIWIDVTDAAIGLRRASKNKETWTRNYVFSVVELLKKKVTSQEIFELVCTSNAHRWTTSTKDAWPQYEKEQIRRDIRPHFLTSATKSRCLEGTKTAVALPQCSEGTEKSIAGW